MSSQSFWPHIWFEISDNWVEIGTKGFCINDFYFGYSPGHAAFFEFSDPAVSPGSSGEPTAQGLELKGPIANTETDWNLGGAAEQDEGRIWSGHLEFFVGRKIGKTLKYKFNPYNFFNLMFSNQTCMYLSPRFSSSLHSTALWRHSPHLFILLLYFRENLTSFHLHINTSVCISNITTITPNKINRND